MAEPPEYEYTVLLVFPGFGPEREAAEEVVERALDWLNANKTEPGFRFAPPVGAALEIVSSADAARDRLEADDAVAMVVMHDLDPAERDELHRDCAARNVSVCYAVDAPRPAGDGELRLVLAPKPAKELSAHRLAAATFTDPVEDDEDADRRVGQVIAVLALGVMSHHWGKMPRRWPPLAGS